MRLFVEINIRGTTVFVATHDLELIRRMGKRVADARGKLRSELPRSPRPGSAVPAESRADRAERSARSLRGLVTLRSG